MYRRFFKRLFDVVLSFLGIVILSPVMLIVAIAVKCDSKGPIIFKSPRLGKNKKIFNCYKFRSMTTNAPSNLATNAIKSENYITKTGAFLRKTSLDELPQMLNILKGDMSIIGPRPTVTSEIDLIEERDKYGANDVTPGLTGLAQVNGRDVTARDFRKKAQYDGEYVKKITFIKDLKIFFKTIAIVFKQKDIEEGGTKKIPSETPVVEEEQIIAETR
jgi:O-antigen biosynthesis protein WbqP